MYAVHIVTNPNNVCMLPVTPRRNYRYLFASETAVAVMPATAKHDDFWDSIAAAHRLEEGQALERPTLTPDPLESEPESDEEDRADGIFSPQFVQTTGVHEYMRTCREAKVVPVQQFISMLDHEVVSLKHRGVGPLGGRAIFECLRYNKHIQALDMEDNQLGLNVDVDAGHLDHVCAALRENQVITNLDLSYNNFAARGCVAIAEALESNSRIKELSLRGNNMGDMGAQRLAETINKSINGSWLLSFSSKLSKIDLSDNGIGESGGSALGTLIASMRPLKQADFSWNSVRSVGAIAIAEGLKVSSLVRLNLAWNGLGERGATAIGHALKENSALLFLDVSSNRIAEEGSKAIADGLRENQTLRSLQLNGNPIGDQGVTLLIEAVGIFCAVRDLGLQDCSTKKTAAGLFDPLNPTGRYTLELDKEFDRELLKRLKQLDSSDEQPAENNFMNVRYNSKQLDVNLADWPVANTGILNFDYVSSKRVPKDAKAQRDEVFYSFRKELANPALSEDTKLLMIRASATTHFWNCAQVRQLIQLITFRQRVDAVIILFRRIVDLESSFHAVVYSSLKPGECKALRLRLGSPLARILPEETPAPEETAVVFLTEQHEGLLDKDAAAERDQKEIQEEDQEEDAEEDPEEDAEEDPMDGQEAPKDVLTFHSEVENAAEVVAPLETQTGKEAEAEEARAAEEEAPSGPQEEVLGGAEKEVLDGADSQPQPDAEADAEMQHVADMQHDQTNSSDEPVNELEKALPEQA